MSRLYTEIPIQEMNDKQLIFWAECLAKEGVSGRSPQSTEIIRLTNEILRLRYEEKNRG